MDFIRVDVATCRAAGHNRSLDAELSPTDVARSEANLSVDALLTSAGGFGKAQMLTTAVALFAWVVRGAGHVDGLCRAGGRD